MARVGRFEHEHVTRGVHHHDGSSVPAEVYVAEALGNETLVRLRMDGQELVARADADFEPAVGSQLWVRPNLARAHLFDGGTQQRII